MISTKSNIILIIGIFISTNFIILHPGCAQVHSLRITIQDSKTQSPLSYCSIAFKNRTFGKVSNELGEFQLRIDSTLLQDTIEISRIGYKPVLLSISKIISENITLINLQEQPIILPDLTVASDKVDWIYSLMENVIDSIASNYIIQPFSFSTTISRAGLNDHFTNKIQALCHYKNGYNTANSRNKNTSNHQFYIDKDCYSEYSSDRKKWINKDYNNEMYNDILGFFLRDFVAYRNNTFLNKKNLNKYSFDLEEESKTQLVIRYEANKLKFGIVPFMILKSFTGKLVIDPKSFAIKKIVAYMVVNQKTMNKAFDTDLVGKIEITTLYSRDKNGKYFWLKGFYQDNYFLKTEVINENTIMEYGNQDYAHTGRYLNENLLCK